MQSSERTVWHPGDTSASDAGGRAWLYVLAANGAEDLLKVGLTNNPLSRWSAFHPRWFEVFDLDHSLLVACEGRRDAQALETALHRELGEYACPMPLTIRIAARGSTEWYRGAYPHAQRFVDACEANGHVVARDARAFLAPAMRADAERLDGLLRQAHSELLAGWLSEAQRRAMVDLVDAHCMFDPALDEGWPQEALRDLRHLPRHPPTAC